MNITVKMVNIHEIEDLLGFGNRFSLSKSMKKKAGAVLYNVIKRVQSNVRKNLSTHIKKRYIIKAKDVKDCIYSHRPTKQDLNGSISIIGEKVPLYKFSVKPKEIIKLEGIKPVRKWEGGKIGAVKYPGRTRYKFKVLKSSSLTKSETSFVQKMPTGHVGIFKRRYLSKTMGKGDNSIRELYGPAVPQMAGSEFVSKKVLQDAEKVYNERLEHELNRVLGRL